MKVTGTVRNFIKKEITWKDSIVASTLLILSRTPSVDLSMDNKVDVIKRGNGYSETRNINSIVGLPVKIGVTIRSLQRTHKNDFICIKVSPLAKCVYHIELYDGNSEASEFNTPIFAFTRVIEDCVDKEIEIKEEKVDSDIEMFNIAFSYILAKRYDIVINRMLAIKAIAPNSYCINKNGTVEGRNLINNQALNIKFDIIKTIEKFISNLSREKINSKGGMFGNFGYGLSPCENNYLILRMDNQMNSLTHLLYKIEKGMAQTRINERPRSKDNEEEEYEQ